MGRKAPRPGSKRPRLANFTTVSLPAAGLDIDWILGRTDWGMMGNDRRSNCTAVALAHQLMAWAEAIDGQPYDVQEAAATDLYTAATAKEGHQYDPVTGKNDDGAYMADVLAVAQQSGLEGHKIDGWLSIEPGHLDESRFGLETFGGLLCGMALPAHAKEQFEAHQPWSVVSPWSAAGRAGSWGEHEVVILKASPEELFCVTWGGVQPMTNQFFCTYADDVLVAVYSQFLHRHCLAAPHIAKQELYKELADVGPHH